MTEKTASLLVFGAQISEAGIKESNDDAVAMRMPTDSQLRTKGVVAALADGVSGASAARVAAESCVLGFLSDYYSTPLLWSVPRSAQRVLESLNMWLSGNTQLNGGHLCTLSILILRSRTAHIFQVGDSRVWRLRQNRLECLTTDHVRKIGAKKYLTRAMGMDARLDVDYLSESVEVGDRYLLTSDGIHEVLSSARIQGILRGGGELDNICKVLIDTALQSGADDNVSCQLLEVITAPEPGAADTLTAMGHLPFPPPLQEGMEIDGLAVLKELHASNRSHLYLVKDTKTAELLVLKAPSINLVDDRDAIERLSLESWIGARVRHPNLVQVRHAERPRSCIYYLMEYVDGVTLQQWRIEHPDASLQEMLFLFDQLLNGLRALHRADVIHADIKPANIMIQRDGTVKVIDYGSCHARGLLDANLKKDSVPLGVRQYTAPEVYAGEMPTERSDLFSVAAVLYEYVTGITPWNGQHDKMQSDPLPSVQQYNRFVPNWLNGILARALAFDKKERFSDAPEFRAALAGKDHLDWTPAPSKLTQHIWQWISAGLLIALVVSHVARTLLMK